MWNNEFTDKSTVVGPEHWCGYCRAESSHEINTLKATVVLLDSRVKILEAMIKSAHSKGEATDSTVKAAHGEEAENTQHMTHKSPAQFSEHPDVPCFSREQIQRTSQKDNLDLTELSSSECIPTQDCWILPSANHRKPFEHLENKYCESDIGQAGSEGCMMETKDFQDEFNYLSSLATAEFINVMTSRNDQLEENLRTSCKKIKELDPGYSSQQFLQGRERRLQSNLLI